MGDIVLGRFEVRKSLGVGCLGTAVSVFDRKRLRRAVLKAFHPAVAPSESVKHQFLGWMGEQALSHSSVAPILESGVDAEGRLFVIRDFVEGTPLRTILEERRASRAPLSPVEVASIVDKLARVYADLPGFAHGCLAPERIWLDGDEPLESELFVTSSAEGRGFPPQVVWHRVRSVPLARGYVPPELLMGRTPNRRSDVYAVGVLIGELLTGAIFEGQAKVFRVESTEIDEGVFKIVEKAVQALPNRRYVDVHELNEALGEFVSVPVGGPKEVPPQYTFKDAPDTEVVAIPGTEEGSPKQDEVIFEDTAQVSMEEVIRAHGDAVAKETAREDDTPLRPPARTNARKVPSPVELPRSRMPSVPPPLPKPGPRMPSRMPPPVPAQANLPSRIPPPVPNAAKQPSRVPPPAPAGQPSRVPPPAPRRADDSFKQSDPRDETKKTRKEPSVPGTEAPLSISKAAEKLEQQADEAVVKSTDELLKRADRLDGVDPRLVRAAHTLETEKIRDKSIEAAKILRDKGEQLDGIDPRFLRAAAKLEQAKVRGGSARKGKKDDSEEVDGEARDEPSDAVISFLAPPVASPSSSVTGFPKNRQTGVHRVPSASRPRPPKPSK